MQGMPYVLNVLYFQGCVTMVPLNIEGPGESARCISYIIRKGGGMTFRHKWSLFAWGSAHTSHTGHLRYPLPPLSFPTPREDGPPPPPG